MPKGAGVLDVVLNRTGFGKLDPDGYASRNSVTQESGFGKLDPDGFGVSSLTSGATTPGPVFRRQRKASRYLTFR